MQQAYIYCGDADKVWEIFGSDGVCSSSALSGLYDSGTLCGRHRVRIAGETEWSLLEDIKEEAKRIGYGQLLPKIFSNRWCWYKGHSGEKQGPFDESKMITWFKMGYLYEELKICMVSHLDDVPKEDDFLSLKDLLMLFSQPVFVDISLANTQPIEDVRLLHCDGKAWSAFVGEMDDIQRLPKQLPGLLDCLDRQQDASCIIKDAGQKIIDGLSDRASKLFVKNSRVWYYLGRGSTASIHGPYDGIKMSVWFRKGWLSLDLCLWSTDDIAEPIDIKRFRRLGEVLTLSRNGDIQW